jgi:hypothetical protein
MLTPFEENLLPSLLQRTFASRALDVAKMKAFVPCDVDDRLNQYKAKIVEAVYDPLRVPEVNARFRAAGYDFADDMQVIAVTEDGAILLWGGLNSVFHLHKGETIAGAFDEKHLAFNDILDLTNRFKIKNKKVEIDELIADLKQKYGGTKQERK